MNFVIAPLQMGLLRDISATVHRIDRRLDLMQHTLDGMVAILMEGQPMRSPKPLGPLSPRLESKFRDALDKKLPATYATAYDIPMDAGFRALHHNFKQSTRKSQRPETDMQSVSECVNLAKCRFLVHLLQQSSEYNRAYYRKGAILEIEQLIAQEYARPDLTVYTEREMLEQPESVYLVWAPEPTKMLELQGLDERILELTLPGGPPEIERPDVVLYRLGPHTLRLDRNFLQHGYSTPRWYSETVNIEANCLVPRYAAFKATPFSIELSGMGAMRGTHIDLASKEDVFALQKALTGYHVLEDKESVDVAIGKRSWLGIGSTLQGGRGRIQIWQWAASPHLNTPARPDSPLQSRFSIYSETMVNRVTSNINPSILSTVEDKDGNTTIYAYKPPLPVMVMFVPIRGGFNMFHLECGCALLALRGSDLFCLTRRGFVWQALTLSSRFRPGHQ